MPPPRIPQWLLSLPSIPPRAFLNLSQPFSCWFPRLPSLFLPAFVTLSLRFLHNANRASRLLSTLHSFSLIIDRLALSTISKQLPGHPLFIIIFFRYISHLVFASFPQPYSQWP